MSKPTKQPKIDPIFAAIEAHRQATATRYPILEAMCGTKDGTAKHTALWIDHDEALSVEVKATVKLRKIQPTTIAGVAAVTAYFVEYIDHYPDCPWITDPKKWDDPYWFEHALIRNLAAALAKINALPVQ